MTLTNNESSASKVIFGNHASVLVPRKDRDNIRKFYCDVLGGRITKAEDDRDFLCLGENFFIGFLYGDVPDESEFLRSARSVWLEIKSDDVEEVSRKILESGLIRKLELPDPHLYFQAPGGQCLRLVGIREDMSFYEGAGAGPDVAKVKEALRKMESYTVTIEVAQSPNDVFNHITNDVAKWWGGKDFEGCSKNMNDEFIIHHPGSHYSKQKVVEIIPDKKIIWLVTESTLDWLQKDKHEWKNTKMIFEISPSGDKTILKFTHEGLIPDKECYSLCYEGWNTVIKDYLFNYINESKAHFLI